MRYWNKFTETEELPAIKWRERKLLFNGNILKFCHGGTYNPSTLGTYGKKTTRLSPDWVSQWFSQRLSQKKKTNKQINNTWGCSSVRRLWFNPNIVLLLLLLIINQQTSYIFYEIPIYFSTCSKCVFSFLWVLSPAPFF